MYKYDFGGLRTRAATIVALAAAAVFAVLSASAAARAEDHDPALRAALLRSQVVAESALYETTEDGRVFVLDRTHEPPLLEFRDSFEVFALQRVPAARGDEILRTDTGDNLVRITTSGAVTLYPREHPTGLPAARLGPAKPLPALGATAVDIGAALQALAAQAGEAKVDAPPSSAAAADALLADAVRLTAEGLRASSAAGPSGAAKLGQLTRIEFRFGDDADASIDHGVLRVQINQDAGYAGRPSSLRIRETVLGGG
jgi:hypothetical protein